MLAASILLFWQPATS